MSAVVFAYHDVGCMGLRVLRRLGIEVARVYTHEDDPAETTWFQSVQATCRELALDVAAGADPNSPQELERIARIAPTALFSFYYRDLLKRPLLAIPRRGGVNLHGSLLPRYRGRAPVNWQLLHGERESGATLHYMVAKADAGDIVDQEPFPIGPDDTPTDVFRKLLPAAERVLERSAASVMDGSAPRIRQLESKATTFGRRSAADGAIDWRHSATDVRNLVRAVTTPYPGAFTWSGERRLLVWWAEADGSTARAPRPPGTVERAGDSVLVTCGDRRRLRLERVECDGAAGRAAEFSDLFRDGTILGTRAAGAK